MTIKNTLLLLLLLFSLGCTQVPAEQQLKHPIAVQGKIDLSGQSITEPIALNGTWDFYWNELVQPRELALTAPEEVAFPHVWTEKNGTTKTYPSYGYGTYRVELILPKAYESLQITLPDTYSAYRFYINDKLAASNGEVGTRKEDFKPYWERKTVRLPADADTLQLTLQIANFSHHKGGIARPIMIGAEAQIQSAAHMSDSIDLLLTGCLLMGGIFFLGLYTVGNRDKAILFYALFSIVYSYRIIGTENYVLHSLFPNINWYVAIRFEYISLFLGIGLFNSYTSYLYPLDVNKTIIKIINTICFGFSALSLLLPPYYFTQFLDPFIIAAIFTIIYVPFIYIRAYQRNRPAAIMSLLGSVSILVAFFVTLLSFYSLIPSLQILTFFCYINFFFLQTIILANRIYYKLKMAGMEAQQGLLAKSEFLSTMSHEIRTPLNAVIGMSHLLLQHHPREDQKEHLDVMLFSANNLLSIVNDILDYNKIEAGKILFEHIEMDLVSIAKNIVAGLNNTAADKNIVLRLNADDAIRHKVIGDPTRITQVVSNLVHNAIKFTQVGGVDVGLSVLSQNEQQITIKVEVIDTGIGISKEKQGLIFERFTQADSSTSRSYGGAGLGLAISKRILELQHSSLSLESEEGCGSNFFFIMTFEKGSKLNTADAGKVTTSQASKLLSDVQILLVDDNKMNVMVAKKFLEQWGAVIDVAYDGEEALETLDVEKHNLVLMDLHMPVLDGYEATKRMRSAGVSIPIIALTANVPDQLSGFLYETGLDDYVTKPFMPEELYNKVLHHVSGKGVS